jgi:hypothetical protein
VGGRIAAARDEKGGPRAAFFVEKSTKLKSPSFNPSVLHHFVKLPLDVDRQGRPGLRSFGQEISPAPLQRRWQLII